MLLNKIALLSRFLVIKTRKSLAKIRPWGFFGLSLLDVGSGFYYGVTRGAMTLKASAIAFDFFLAMFPAIIVVFTIIPFLPIQDYQQQLLEFIATMMPKPAYEMVESTIVDILSNPRSSLLSVSLLGALYFATSGFSTMIAAFNETVNSIEKRAWWAQKLVAFSLMLIMFTFVTVAIVLTTVSSKVFDLLIKYQILKVGVTFYLLILAKWVITIFLIYFSIASLYYLAPDKKSNFRFFSPGAILATVLSVFMMLGFSYYINNFGSYNTLYGSLGTLIVLLVWVRMNSLIILVGFELNASVFGSLAKQNQDKSGLKA